MNKKLILFGVLAPLIYTSHVLIGGILWEGYSHLEQPISDLTASGAPDRNLLTLLTVLYGICSIIFSLSAYIYLKGFAPEISQVGMVVLLIMHCISITYNLFPQDFPGGPVTFRGVMHIVITALIIPLTILSPILVGLGMRKLNSFKKYGGYSIVTGVFIFIIGLMVVIFIANDLAYIGLLERVNIGALQLWMFITAITLFFSNERDSAS